MQTNTIAKLAAKLSRNHGPLDLAMGEKMDGIVTAALISQKIQMIVITIGLFFSIPEFLRFVKSLRR